MGLSFCDNTASIATLDASVVMSNVASKLRRVRVTMDVIAVLSSRKDLAAAIDHWNCCCFRMSVNGAVMWVYCFTKRQ